VEFILYSMVIVMSISPDIAKDLFFEAVREAYQFIIENYRRVAIKYSLPEAVKGGTPIYLLV